MQPNGSREGTVSELSGHTLTVNNDEDTFHIELFCKDPLKRNMPRVALGFQMASQALVSKCEEEEEGPDHGLVDSSSDDESKPEVQLSAKQKE